MSRVRDDSQRSLAFAFPFRVQVQARSAMQAMPLADLGPLGHLPTNAIGRYSPPRVADTRLLIPYRIYNPAISLSEVAREDVQFVSTIYTRHHDGFVRQTSLAVALEDWQEWMSPFVVQLLSEYVIEIAVDVETWLAKAAKPVRTDLYRFAASNPGFIAISRARATSYWNEYYRRDCSLRSYPALVALREITGTWR